MSRRSWPVVLGATLLGITVAGCSLFGDPEAEAAQEARNNAEVAAIRERLASEPGVVKVEAGWADNFTTSAEAHVAVVAQPDSDFEQLADAALKEVWRSRIQPLRYISLSVVSSDRSDQNGVSRSYILVERKAELEAKFGPRPVPDDG